MFSGQQSLALDQLSAVISMFGTFSSRGARYCDIFLAVELPFCNVFCLFGGGGIVVSGDSGVLVVEVAGVSVRPIRNTLITPVRLQIHNPLIELGLQVLGLRQNTTQKCLLVDNMIF